MRRVFLAIGCLVAVQVGAQDYSWSGGDGPGSLAWGPSWYDGRTTYNPFNYWDYPRPSVAFLQDNLEQEIARLEGMLDQSTPYATGRYGEVTARFGPQFSPYFWEQVGENMAQPGALPEPGTPEGHSLLVDAAGRALRRHDALIADRLLALYDLRAMRRMAELGYPPSMVMAQRTRAGAPSAPVAAAPTPEGAIAKMATFEDPAGHVLARDAGPQILDTMTFVPDSPRNLVLMVSLQATLQRLDDLPSTATVGLEVDLPQWVPGADEVLPGPMLDLLPWDPAAVRKADSSLCTGEVGTLNGGLHDQPSYKFRLVAPEGAVGGSVKVSDIVLRVYYITGPFVEAGKFVE